MNQKFSSALKLKTLLVLLGMLVSCTAPEENLEPSLSDNRVILARIDGDPVYLSDFRNYIRSFLDGGAEAAGMIPSRELFDEYLTRIILLKEADKAGVKVTDEEIDRHILNWALHSPEESTPDIKKAARDFLKVNKLLKQEVDINLNISLQDLINYYDTNIEGFSIGDQAHVLEILTDEKDQAEELKARINQGDSRKFREMAKTFSKGATAENEGDLGFFQKGDLPKEFDKVIFSLKPGEISEPFQSSHGYHLFFMEEWIPRHQYKFHEVKAEIFEKIAAGREREKTRDYIDSLLEQYTVTIYESRFPVDAKEYNFDQYDN